MKGKKCPREVPRGHGDDAGEDVGDADNVAAQRGRPRSADPGRQHAPLLEAGRRPHQGRLSIIIYLKETKTIF